MFETIRKWWNRPIVAKCQTCGNEILTASPKERYRSKNKEVNKASIFWAFMQLSTLFAWLFAILVLDNFFMIAWLSFCFGMAFWSILNLTNSKFNELFALEESCSYGDDFRDHQRRPIED